MCQTHDDGSKIRSDTALILSQISLKMLQKWTINVFDRWSLFEQNEFKFFSCDR